MASSGQRTRVALGPRGRRLSFERGLAQRLWLMGLPAGVLCGVALWGQGWVVLGVALLCVAAGWGIVVSLVLERVVRPLQTLANVIAALREDDFSFRARGGRRNDALGDLALEVNALAGLMQGQRGSALEAVALAERVMSAMQTPVAAFDGAGRVKMLNPAAEGTFGVRIGEVRGREAAEIGMGVLLRAGGEESVSLGGSARWVVKRAGFRMRGEPHVLVVLSEVSSALREEERNAWRRLVRVMGHEINNSLTPIKSIAGSLRGRLRTLDAGAVADLERGLGVIESRAESLNRFLQAYRQLSGLPAPRLGVLGVRGLVERVAELVGGGFVVVEGGPGVEVRIDGDQVQQALINLVKNAVEAAMGPDGSSTPRVSVGWGVERGEVVVAVVDNGPGVSNPGNLFVPFYTTKPEGTGIGLALALEIAEVNGGTVRLQNREDGPGAGLSYGFPCMGGVNGRGERGRRGLMAIEVNELTTLLEVFDLPASLRFYQDVLGFTVVNRTEGWCMLKLGPARLMLNTAYDVGERPEKPEAHRVIGHGDTSLYFGVSDLNKVYVQLVGKGWSVMAPEATSYGMRQVSTRDPDGFRVFFLSPE